MLVHRYGERARARGRAAAGAAGGRDPAHDPVPGVAEDTSTRRGPAPSCRRPGGRGARAHRERPARGGRPAAADPAGHRGVDQRRGTGPGARRPRRGVLRGLPRGQGHRVGAGGAAFDDVELEAFLEPWRGRRGRVQATVGLAGLPRRGPRMSPRGRTSGERHPALAARTGERPAGRASVRAADAGCEHELGELAVQVPGLPLAARGLQGCWTRRPRRSPRAPSRAPRRSPRR